MYLEVVKMKETMGVVLETDAATAKVKINRHGECSNCGACPGDSAMVIDVRNKICAKPGQRVIINMPEDNMLKAAFVVYLIPLIAAVIGYSVGVAISTAVGINSTFTEVLFSFLFVAVSIVNIKSFDKSAKNGKLSQPEIVRICA
jgi:sigma-E factor negative regulatory protein RseC